MHKMIMFIGPRGVGKDTLARYTVETFPQCEWSVATTTREMRPGEVNGRDYFFISKEEFEKKIAEGEFAEYDYHFNAYYGTSRTNIEKMWAEGKIPVKDNDYKGATILKNLYGESVFIVFIKTSSVEVLEKRMRLRGADNPELLEKQLKDAKDRYLEEMAFESKADFVLINDDLDTAKADLKAAIEKFIQSN